MFNFGRLSFCREAHSIGSKQKTKTLKCGRYTFMKTQIKDQNSTFENVISNFTMVIKINNLLYYNWMTELSVHTKHSINHFLINNIKTL